VADSSDETAYFTVTRGISIPSVFVPFGGVKGAGFAEPTSQIAAVPQCVPAAGPLILI